MAEVATDNSRQVLKDVFGYDEFRPLQEDIIASIVAGDDALVLMPTGGGKSLCYQVPALVRPGCGIVVSPLIALMKDQVDALAELGVRAAFVNSSQSAWENDAVERQLLAGELDLLYIAPERLVMSRTLELLDRASLSLFAIDEAHCVSQWGHDFREDYLALDCLAERYPGVPRIALTATADGRTRREIAERLRLDDAGEFVASFNRPNIRYAMSLKDNGRRQLTQFLRANHPGDAGIVYCLSRRRTEEVAGFLTADGIEALPYHAGLPPEERAKHQSRFLREEGLVMVATIAFGMGIDKPDVRFVVHLDLPKTVESYYQEPGRAGRDGEPANAYLLYGLQDVTKLRQMLLSGGGSEEHLRREQIRLNAMLGLCEITTCRRHALLSYFGESSPETCGNCDNCLSAPETFDGTEAAQKALSAVYRTGQRFGVGYLVDVLMGKETDRIFSFDHHHLPVFGKGNDLDTRTWQSVFRQLIARGYVDVDIDGYGGLRLNEKCRPLLRGDESITFRRDLKLKSSAKRSKKAVVLPENVDASLFDALREHRRILASEQGVPPYFIFHDSTLKAMAAEQPTTLDAFAMLPGVGESKLENYGRGFVDVVLGHTATGGAHDS